MELLWRVCCVRFAFRVLIRYGDDNTLYDNIHFPKCMYMIIHTYIIYMHAYICVYVNDTFDTLGNAYLLFKSAGHVTVTLIMRNRYFGVGLHSASAISTSTVVLNSRQTVVLTASVIRQRREASHDARLPWERMESAR